jgi:hypothetical protein
MDARFSCHTASLCAEESKCLATNGSSSDAVINVDAFEVAEFRDFGSGVKLTSLSVCGPITGIFRLPNFCTCRDSRLGNFGYSIWASFLGVGRSVGRTWSASFSTNVLIPGASFEIGAANVGARAELSGTIARFIISTNLAIGVCARLGIGFFSKEICNPSALRWLPITILNGPRFDFSRFCV